MGKVEALSPYAAWKALAAGGNPLQTGDALEEVRPDGAAGTLYLAKYVGFEAATWFLPEAKPENEPNSCSQ